VRGLLVAPLVAFALGLTLLFAPRGALADERDFTLVNASPFTITHVYVSASDRSSWEEDLLGNSVLPSGQSVNIRFSPYDVDAGKCFYDIRVLGPGGREGTLWNVNLCTTTTVTFR
jgi:hypothetical protein